MSLKIRNISVVIPMYNAEKNIVEALDSVKHQTGDFVFEIIVIDDGSTDESKKIVEQYISDNQLLDIKLISQTNKGVSSARNKGLKIAKYDFIALLDADDEWLPVKTERQIYHMEKEKSIDFISCRVNDNPLLFPYNTEKELVKVNFNQLIFRNSIPSPTVIFKRKILDNTGYFSENQRYAEDINYWLKISLHNQIYILNESLVIAGKGKRSFGVSGLSANLSEMEKGHIKNLKDMRNMNKISFISYIFYRILYKMKYFVLILRTRLAKK